LGGSEIFRIAEAERSHFLTIFRRPETGIRWYWLTVQVVIGQMASQKKAKRISTEGVGK
jgi:hypothetical protein